jgi:hypothetical protein
VLWEGGSGGEMIRGENNEVEIGVKIEKSEERKERKGKEREGIAINNLSYLYLF